DAIIIKERYLRLGDPAAQKFALTAWQPMVRRAADVADGWFWGEHSQAEGRKGEVACDNSPRSWDDPNFQQVDDCRPPSGFGQPCIRCHASAPSDLTFAQLTHLPESTH